MKSTDIRRRIRRANKLIDKTQCELHERLVKWTAAWFTQRSRKKSYKGTKTIFGMVNGAVQYRVELDGKVRSTNLPEHVGNLWVDACDALGSELLWIPTTIEVQDGEATLRVWDKTWEIDSQYAR